MAESKHAKYLKLQNGGWMCEICENVLSTRQRVLTHLYAVHKCSPLKRVNKQYADSEEINVPRSTLYKWKKVKFDQIVEGNCPADDSLSSHDDAKNTEPSTLQHVDGPANIHQDEGSNSTGVEYVDSDNDFLQNDPFQPVGTATSNIQPEQESNSPGLEDVDSNSLKIDDNSDSYDSTCEIHYQSSDTNNESDTDLESSDNISSEDIESDCSLKQTNENDKDENLSLLACFIRNKLNASACKDLIGTLKSTFKNSKEISELDYNTLLSNADSTPVHEVHYCTECFEVFPSDINVFRCQSQNCTGLRYKGPMATQEKMKRQPRQSLVFPDVKIQLSSLLETPGIWQDIQETKDEARCRLKSGSRTLTDIVDGSGYRSLMGENGFLHEHSNNLTAVFNTDGVNLFSSSKTDLWPIFLAINELSPSKRFSRENILLAGIWQGHGKPPFNQFLKVFVETMNLLNTEGVTIKIDDKCHDVKLQILCCIADLPAKAELLKMSYYNGPHACITCEEEGQTVEQGKGHSKCYAYKVYGERSNTRTHETILDNMSHGSARNRSKGFKGRSALADLKNYNIVDGVVPEYMHAILLGVTKSLLTKWFSPVHSRKEYFIGNHLKEISKRMNNFKPPHGIERLPRDLEKNYSHLKASELQSWLLYYGFPCVNGFLKEEYLENFSYLSEAVHLLLSDAVTPEMVVVAEELLDQFYSSFQRLYGDGSCGLNVHNTSHLSRYVRLWGPLWAWSAFPFEDSNAAVLQCVHGTGIVLKQIIRFRQVQLSLRRNGIDVAKKEAKKVTHEANNCGIVGISKPVQQEQLENEVVNSLNLNNNTCNVSECLMKVSRVLVDGKLFYSEEYSRMKKRVCSLVLFQSSKVGTVKYFILYGDIVYAVVQNMERVPLEQLPGVRLPNHYMALRHLEHLSVVNVIDLVKVLVYLDIAKDYFYAVPLPNHYGHAVFK